MSAEDQEMYRTKKNEVYLSYIRKMEEDEILPGVKTFLAEAHEYMRKGIRLPLVLLARTLS